MQRSMGLCNELGRYVCHGYDTFGPLKLMGGMIQKGHPDEKDVALAVEFYKNLG